nr:hypothetical protein Itr_chr03CG13000 [Ipomoea trifida]
MGSDLRQPRSASSHWFGCMHRKRQKRSEQRCDPLISGGGRGVVRDRRHHASLSSTRRSAVPVAPPSEAAVE